MDKRSRLKCVVAVTPAITFCFAITVCYSIRWENAAPLTLFPFWAWAIPGIGLAILAGRCGLKRFALVLTSGWLILSLFFSDDLSSLVRSVLRKPRTVPESTTLQKLRVITLNCAGQNTAAQEVLPWKPDLVLLQESPSSNDVATLARELFGPEAGFSFGFDCSVIARDQVSAAAGPKTIRYNRVTLRSPRVGELEVVSLRLEPPETRFDLWSSACWQAHRQNRERRREQLQQAIDALTSLPSHRACLVGGDFNAPAGDTLFRVMRGTFQDTFREAGRGWGNTALNEFPCFRVDQIWVNERWRTVTTRAVKTRHSDHRMVVCDLVREST
jgi:vancomycin resistance protein VanJ